MFVSQLLHTQEGNSLLSIIIDLYWLTAVVEAATGDMTDWMDALFPSLSSRRGVAQAVASE